MTTDTVDTELKCTCSDQTEALIEELFQMLPAHSHDEIAERLGIMEHNVSDLLTHLRGHAVEHGWTVPHARRGKTTEEPRYYAVLVSSEGEPYADLDGRMAVAGGLDGTLANIETMAANEFAALEMFKAYLPHTLQRRKLTRIMRALRNLNEEAKDARDEGWGWAENGDA